MTRFEELNRILDIAYRMNKSLGDGHPMALRINEIEWLKGLEAELEEMKKTNTNHGRPVK